MLLPIIALALAANPYDPMTLDAGSPTVLDEVWKDSSRNRSVPIRAYLPSSEGAHPVLIFSHGLGGSCKNNPYLGEHLARRGYITLYLQHAGSDESVWKDARPLQRMQAMRKAASAENLKLRAEDVRFAIDELTRRNFSAKAWKGRANVKQIGMFGHSFGAVTTQAVSGQDFPVVGTRWTDGRIRAAIMYSGSAQNTWAFAQVKVPWMHLTGTLDDSPIRDTKAADRLKLFDQLPPGKKYECVLWEATHGAFGEGRLRPGEPRNENHHRVILALTTAFFDAYVRGNSQAETWLSGKGPRSVMEQKDTWRKK